MAGIYVHIPFCKQACYYCDFHFSTNQSLRTELIGCLVDELRIQKNYLQQDLIETIYFGGGTPSLLSAKELEVVFDSIYKNQPVADTPEITLEANPDDLAKEKIRDLKEIGINRLSLGIQSFDDTILKFLNRAHNSKEALSSIHHLRDAGFTNLSIDLIHSIPGQSEQILMQNLEMIINLKLPHISVYSLTLEEKTVFGKWAKKGQLKRIEENQSAAQFEMVMDTLISAGYQHYEISNYCLPGYASQHNSSYWQQKRYLGIGPSAHSYDGTSRQFNVNNNHLYMRAIHDGKIPSEIEVLTRENMINEYIFTSLRTSHGCHLPYLIQHHDYDLGAVNESYINSLLDHKLAIIDQSSLILTRSGKLLADKIASDLFATLE